MKAFRSASGAGAKPAAAQPAALKKALFFAESLAKICARSQVAPGRPLRWIIIANPTAGGFCLRARWARHRRALEECAALAEALPLRDSAPAQTAARFAKLPELAACGFAATEAAGSAAEIAKALAAEAAASLKAAEQAALPGKSGAAPEGEAAAATELPGESGAALEGALPAASPCEPSSGAPFYLVIVAGGDGTSLEALSVLLNAPEAILSGAALPGASRPSASCANAACANMAILRLPMGTGNDGADFPELADALALLIRPSRIELTPALRLRTAPGGRLASQGPFLAFNILSVGLDAFVTHMTNKTKKKSPGDFYKLWVDIAALLYDRLYTVGILDVKALDAQGSQTMALREKLLLLAVGASGRRTYGSQKKILPDDRNVCALRQMPLLRKLALKGLFATGAHASKPEAALFSAQRIEFSGAHPMLAQMDGETVLLQKEDFPAAIELTPPAIPVLRLAK